MENFPIIIESQREVVLLLNGVDWHHGWRAWLTSLRRPGFTIGVALTLGVAVGAGTAAFTVVSAVTNILPYSKPDQLILLWEKSRSGEMTQLRSSVLDYRDFAARSKSFASLDVFAPETHTLVVQNGLESLLAPRVGNGFFTLLGVRMLKGRDSGKDDVWAALISEDLWRSRFSSWDDPIGKTIRIDGVNRTIIGVVPTAQAFPPEAKLWIPFVPETENCNCQRNGHSYEIIGRLREGVSVEQATAEVRTIAARLQSEYPDTNRDITAWVQALRDDVTGDLKTGMWMLMGAASALLLMACISVAGMLFARGIQRLPELVMRQVLGATRQQIFAQLIIEAFFGAILVFLVGLVFAELFLHFFVQMIPTYLSGFLHVSLYSSALAFALAVGVATIVLSTLLSAVHAMRKDSLQDLRVREFSGTASRKHPFRRGLVIAEHGIGFALLIITFLLLNSLLKLVRVPLGFVPHKVLRATVTLDSTHYATAQQVFSFYENALERIRSLPQVDSAAATSVLPLTGSTEGVTYFGLDSSVVRSSEETMARASYVTPQYFAAMGIPMIRGRDFDPLEDQHSHVVVISEGVARQHWPNESPVGKHIALKGAGGISWEIIGLVQDTRDDGLSLPAPSRIYFNEQEAGERTLAFVVRTKGAPGRLVGSLRSVIASMDSSLSLYNVGTVQELVDSAVSRNILITKIVGIFSLVVVTLATLGLYGVILSNMLQRMREFGIRIAVGAPPAHLAWLVLRQCLLLAGIGVILGLIVATLGSHILSNMLYGVGVLDGASLVAALSSQFLMIVAVCFGLLRRLKVLDPVTILRTS